MGSLLVAMGATACGPAAAPITETLNLGLAVENGVSLNGTAFSLSPLSTVNTSVYSPFRDTLGSFPTWRPPIKPAFDGGLGFDPYAGVGPNGQSFDGVQLEELYGLKLDTGIRIDDLVGAEVRGRTAEGKSALLQISGVAAGGGANADLLYYAVYAAQGPDWVPMCGTGSDGEPVPALALPGHWDQRAGVRNGGKWKHSRRTFSFACRGSSIAKCMEAGYKPWTDPTSSPSARKTRGADQAHLPNHLQACVRMLRADYCGDGRTFTTNGRRVEFWDTMRLHNQQQGWRFEGGWGPDGATCLSKTPRLGNGYPSCAADRVMTPRECHGGGRTATQLYDAGVMLMNSFDHRQPR